MPNYNIPQGLRDHITQNGLRLANRAVNLALGDFPLTTAQIQYHCAALTQDQVNILRRLDGEGVRTIEHHRQLRLAFIRDSLPELRRGVVLMLQLPEWVVVGRGTQWGISTTKFEADESHYIVPSLSELDARSRKDLITWIDRALRQVRLFEITDYCLKYVLEQERTPTTSHLHAFWPTLTTLVEPDQLTHTYGRGGKNSAARWQDRFRNPTRSLRAYQPDTDVKNKVAKLLVAADTMLAAGRVLPDYSPPGNTIRVQIEHWERLAGDPVFPLPE
jgi:hypothetical protein